MDTLQIPFRKPANRQSAQDIVKWPLLVTYINGLLILSAIILSGEGDGVILWFLTTIC